MKSEVSGDASVVIKGVPGFNDNKNLTPKNKGRKRADTTPTKVSSNDEDVKFDIRKSPINKVSGFEDKNVFSS